MIERCKKKHWWNRDPHDWETYEGWDNTGTARICRKCGLMQTQSGYRFNGFDDHYWVYEDATKAEFDRAVARYKEIVEKERQEKVARQKREKQIEKNRLQNVLRSK